MTKPIRYASVAGLLALFSIGTACSEAEPVGSNNAAPTAKIEGPSSPPTGEPVTFDGSNSSDPDGDPLTFKWGLETPAQSSAKLNSTKDKETTFTPDVVGTYTVKLTVSDGKTASETASTEVQTSNAAPVAKTNGPKSVLVDESVSLDGSKSSDPNGDELTFQWRLTTKPQGSASSLARPNSAEASITPDRPGTYEVQLEVSDGDLTDTATVEVTASRGQRAPIAEAGPSQSVEVGAEVQLDGSQSRDPDSDTLQFTWSLSSKPDESQASLSDKSSPSPTFTADIAGEYGAKLTVSDGEASDSDTVLITAQPPNQPPTAKAGSNKQVAIGQQTQLDGSASTDPDGDQLTYKWAVDSKPTGSSSVLNGADSATATFTPDKKGAYQFTLEVSDGNASDTDSMTVEAREDGQTDQPPTAEAGASKTATVETQVSLDGTGSSDPEDGPDELTFAWNFESQPSGASAQFDDPSVAEPTFTPTVTGTFEIGLTVTDTAGNTATDSTTVEVKESQPSSAMPDTEGDIVITEIMNNPDTLSDNQGEWFEIYNTSASDTLDLKDCVLSDTGNDSHTISSELKIGPQNYATLATSSNPGFSPDYVYSGLSLVNSADELILTCGGTEIDRVAWDDGNTFPAPTGASMNLGPNQKTASGNDSGGNWCNAQTDYNGDLGTPGAKNDSCSGGGGGSAQPPSAEGDLIVTEIMQNPSALADSDGEWFELHNPDSSTTYDLDGCVLEDAGSDSHTISQTLEVGPGEYSTLARSGSPGFSPDYVHQGDIVLANSSDEIILTCNGTEIDRVEYDDGATFPDPNGASMELDPRFFNATDNDNGTYWSTTNNTFGSGDNGSPGAAP